MPSVFAGGIAAALLSLFGRMPHRRACGRLLGRVFMLASGRRRVAAANLRAAFPSLPAAARARLLRRHFAALGEWFMDTLWALSADDEKIRRYVRMEGDFPTPCILMTPHFLGLDLAALRLGMAARAPVAYYYKPMHNRFWDRLINGLRQRHGAVGLPTSSRAALVAGARCLRRGGILIYLPDIDPKTRKSTIFAPFLGVARAATTAALPRLAGSGKAPVVPAIVEQTPSGYTLRFLPPLSGFAAGDHAADVGRVNALIGEWVERQPQNYFWLHRRFKTRAPGDAPIY